MILIDNFKLFREHMFFETNDVYVLKVIVRNKDNRGLTALGSNEGERTIKSYFIYDFDYYDKCIQAVKRLCLDNNARAYISAQAKKGSECVEALMKRCMETWKMMLLDNPVFFKPDKTALSCFDGCDKSYHEKWVIDVDYPENCQDRVSFLNNIIEVVGDCLDPRKYDKTKDMWINPTVNGHHIITSPFTVKLAQEKCPFLKINETIKKNAVTLLYYENPY